MARRSVKGAGGFTLIEVLVAVAILGILMTAIMVAFDQTVSSTIVVQENAEMMQSIRAATEQFHRELSQAIINNNRPDGEQVYFEIRQLSKEQSVLRFGCTTERGLAEIGYMVRTDEGGWHRYELWRLYKTVGMWDYNTPDWPAFACEGPEAEPFAFNIIGFKVYYWSTQKSRWIAGNWESIQRNAMPRRIRIVIKAMPTTRAKEQRKVEDMAKLTQVQEFPVEINLPQAR